MSQASGPPAPLEQDGWRWLPERLRPRTAEPPGTGRMWLIETTLLVLVALLLSIATINDVARQRTIDLRLTADLRTWRHYTGHDYRNVSADQEIYGAGSQKEVACGNISPGPPKAKPQICLAVWGPVVNGMRTVHGGWYLQAKNEDDVRAARYGCFGPAGRGQCPR